MASKDSKPLLPSSSVVEPVSTTVSATGKAPSTKKKRFPESEKKVPGRDGVDTAPAKIHAVVPKFEAPSASDSVLRNNPMINYSFVDPSGPELVSKSMVGYVTPDFSIPLLHRFLMTS